MLIYYATILGAGIGAITALKHRPNLRYVAINVVVYAGVFALIAYGYLFLTNKSG
jgi:hypothetical protein